MYYPTLLPFFMYRTNAKDLFSGWNVHLNTKSNRLSSGGQVVMMMLLYPTVNFFFWLFYCARVYSVEWYDGKLIGKGFGRSSHGLIDYHTNISHEGLRKTKIHLRQKIRFSGWDANGAPPEYESKTLPQPLLTRWVSSTGLDLSQRTAYLYRRQASVVDGLFLSYGTDTWFLMSWTYTRTICIWSEVGVYV